MNTVIVLLVAALPLVVAVVLYNGLVRARNAQRNGYSQIDVQLKQRHDLIPNLVQTVKAYAAHERETLEAVTQARNGAEAARIAARNDRSAGKLAELGRSEAALGSVMGRLFAVSENHPDLKATQNFQHLQEELTSSERRVAAARQFYNDAVTRYNDKVESIPSSLIAAPFGFEQASLLEFDDRDAIQAPPTVSFG